MAAKIIDSENPAGDEKDAAEAIVVRRFSPILAALVTLVPLVWVADIPRRLGFIFFTEQMLVVVLGMGLCLAFLRFPARGGVRRELPWYDAVLAFLALGVTGYIAIRYQTLVEQIYYNREEAFIVGFLLIAASLEGLRRAVGWPFLLLVLAFFSYGLIGDLLPGKLSARTAPFDRLVGYLALDPNALIGPPLMIVATVIIGFLFFGRLLTKSGGSAFFTDLAMVSFGRSRGGAAKIAIVSSALFGSLSGSAVSNVASTGQITIPLMRRSGYPAHVSGAIEAAASTGGQLVPPVMGAAAFLIAEFLQLPYVSVIIAALVPSLLYYAALFVQADLEAARLNITGVGDDLVPRRAGELIRGSFFALPLIAIILALTLFNRTPQFAALVGAVTMIACGLLFGYRAEKLSLRKLIDAIIETGYSVVDLLLIATMAGLVIGVVNRSGLGFGFTVMMVNVGEGNIILLLGITAVACIVLGMGMATSAIYILLATMAAPPLIQLGVEPIAAHLFVMYFGLMSMVTPPIAFAVFAAANLAEANPTRTGLSAIRFSWSAYLIPFLFVLSPSLLLKGGLGGIVFAIFAALVGIWLTSIGVVGYCTRRLGVLARSTFIAAGLAILVSIPGGSIRPFLALGGVLLGVGLYAWLVAARRRVQAA